MENKIATIGNFLKTERKKKALTLEQISADTKIKIRLLQDIENNTFANLGGLGYAKAMIMNYARYLDINEKKTMALLNQTFKIKQEYQRHDQSIQPKKLVLPTNFFAFALLAFVIIILTFFIIHLFRTDTLTWPPFKNIKQKVEVKKVEPKVEKEIKPSKLDRIKQKSKENSTDLNLQINKKALSDTTDHLNEFLFKNKKNSPLNYDN